MATNLIEYSGWALVQWATGRGAGAAALGQLNRGLAFASMPIMAVATSMSNVLVPTYGSTSDRSQHPSLLSRATALSVWAGTLLAALSAGLVYPLMPVVLGGEWSTAASLAVFLAIGSGGSVAGQPMAVFLQSQGRFAEFRRVQYITTALYVFAAAGVIETGHVLWAAVSYAAVTWVRFGLLWARLRVTGELRAWIGREVRIAIVAAGAGGLLVFALAMSCVDRALPLSVSISALAGVVGSLVLIRLGSKVPVLIRELVR